VEEHGSEKGKFLPDFANILPLLFVERDADHGHMMFEKRKIYK